MTSFFRRLRARLRYRRFNAELMEELDVHRAMAEDELRASGEAPEDATRQAARQLGNVTLARESARGVWLAPWLESLWQDVRYALRGLRASPSFTLPVLGVLVITMGLTTSLFVAAESLLFRPWPVADAHRVVKVATTQRVQNAVLSSIGAVEYRYLRDHARSVDLVAMGSMPVRLGTSSDAPMSSLRLVSGNYFSVLGIPLVTGRGLVQEDDDAGDAAVAVHSRLQEATRNLTRKRCCRPLGDTACSWRDGLQTMPTCGRLLPNYRGSPRSTRTPTTFHHSTSL